MVAIEILAQVGFVLSAYALYVEWAHSRSNEKAICDINDRVSCTKAFTSKYGKILGIPNSVFGLVFYFSVLLLSLFGFAQYVWYLAILSVLGSIVLAYWLYAKVKTFCVVCTSIYAVNILLLIFSWPGLF